MQASPIHANVPLVPLFVQLRGSGKERKKGYSLAKGQGVGCGNATDGACGEESAPTSGSAALPCGAWAGNPSPHRCGWADPAVRRGLPDSRWWWAGATAPFGVLHLAAGNDNFTQFVDSMEVQLAHELHSLLF